MWPESVSPANRDVLWEGDVALAPHPPDRRGWSEVEPSLGNVRAVQRGQVLHYFFVPCILTSNDGPIVGLLTYVRAACSRLDAASGIRFSSDQRQLTAQMGLHVNAVNQIPSRILLARHRRITKCMLHSGTATARRAMCRVVRECLNYMYIPVVSLAYVFR